MLSSVMVLLSHRLLILVLLWMQGLYIQVWISVRGYVVSLLLGGTTLVSNLKALDQNFYGLHDLELSW